MAFTLQSLILDPLRGGQHEEVDVPEWDGVCIIVRAPSAGDYAAWRLALREAGKVTAKDDEDTARKKIMQADMSIPSAQLLVRVLYERKGQGDKAKVTRVLADTDVPMLAASWTPVHDRLLEKALTMAGIGGEDEAKNGSTESPTSDS